MLLEQAAALIGRQRVIKLGLAVFQLLDELFQLSKRRLKKLRALMSSSKAAALGIGLSGKSCSPFLAGNDAKGQVSSRRNVKLSRR